jgi:hypothetical protein
MIYPFQHLIPFLIDEMNKPVQLKNFCQKNTTRSKGQISKNHSKPNPPCSIFIGKFFHKTALENTFDSNSDYLTCQP